VWSDLTSIWTLPSVHIPTTYTKWSITVEMVTVRHERITLAISMQVRVCRFKMADASPKTRSVRRCAIIAPSYSYCSPATPQQIVHKNRNNKLATWSLVLHMFLLCRIFFGTEFNITSLISIGRSCSSLPVKYEHFIYISPIPPYWNIVDTVNRILVFRNAEGLLTWKKILFPSEIPIQLHKFAHNLDLKVTHNIIFRSH
jgi:hypothetical protein